MFIDRAKIHVKAGDGGNGVVAFRREKYVPRGGPSGGDGGKGGDIVLEVDMNLSTLMDFKYKVHYKAKRGEHGSGSNKAGKSGENKIIKVPPGTVVKNAETGYVIADLVEPGQYFIVARGGRGGRGNARFASSVHRAPDFAEKGEPGEQKWILLELKLIADVGLIGLPNAGKSTLLARMTSAKPKIADYPFTTLSPNLGVAEKSGVSFVIADIPGLIEGAHRGQGLGHQFLRHIERTRMLVHVIDATGLENDPIQGFYSINSELKEYSPNLIEKPQIIAANKMDIPEARHTFDNVKSFFEREGYEVFPISAVTGQGVTDLIQKIQQMLQSFPRDLSTIEVGQKKEYVLKKNKRFQVKKEGDVFYVSGRSIERIVAMTDLDNQTAVERLQRTFNRIGLDDELIKQGIKPGDTVKIGEAEFYYME
ncbi:MAG: GTPase ObgE [Tepidanaerobacteraceae bacterium]|jgi:GTP-binding protein